MKRHENDLNPGPWTVSGFKAESCYLVKVTDNDQMPFKPTAKGHRWFLMQSGYGFNDLNIEIVENFTSVRPKSKLNEFTGNPGVMSLHLANLSSGFPDSLDASNFQRRTDQLLTHPARAVLTNRSASLNCLSATKEVAEICYSITLNPVCRTVSNLVNPNGYQPFFGHFRSGTSFRWRKNKLQYLLVESALCQKNPGVFGLSKATY